MVIREILVLQMFSPPITDIVEISNSLDCDFPLQIDTLPVKESVTVTSKTTTATTSADSSSSSTINKLYCSKFKKEYGYSIRVFLLFYENAKLILQKFYVLFVIYNFPFKIVELVILIVIQNPKNI